MRFALWPSTSNRPNFKLGFISEVTQIIERAQKGDPRAAEELLPLVYEELRRLASSKMAKEAPGQTLQATALVHEAWLKLAGADAQRWTDRSHFFRAVSEAMRLILIDKARRKATEKHGGGFERAALDDSRIELVAPTDEVLAVHEALDALKAEDPLAAEVVKLRYFVGLTIPEIAEALGLSPRSAERHWSFARAWLRKRIQLG